MQAPPTLDELVAYASGELSPADASALRRRLEALPEQRALVRRLARLATALTIDPAAGPSAAALGAAYRAFVTERCSTLADWLDRAEAWAASLVFDSRTAAAPAGYRGSTSGTHVSLESEVADIDLRLVAGDEGRIRVVGHVEAIAGHDVGQIAAVHATSRDARGAVQPDEAGRFTLDLEPATYRFVLEVDDGDGAVVSSPVDIR